jgi:hypothetical protein
MEVLWRLGYLLAFLAAGLGARSVGVLTERRTDRVTAVAFYVALPSLVFASTYDQRVGELVSPALVAGVVLVIAATAGVAWVTTRREPSRARRSVAVVQSYHSNLGFLGVPLVALTLGREATAVASVVLGIAVLVHVPLTVVVLVSVNDADAAVRSELAALARNPVLVSLALGLAAGSVGVAVPAALGAGLGAVGELALPLALLGVGASLRVEVADVDPGATARVVATKVGLMPAVAWAVFSALAVSRAAFAAAVLMFGMPTAVSTYVYATELGGDPEVASLNVFATTVTAVVTALVVMEFLG